MEIRSEVRFGNALLPKFSDKGQTDLFDLPHFVQVEDIRGEGKGWEVTVKATPFKPTDSSKKPLENSHIIFQDKKIVNTRMDSNEINSIVDSLEKKTDLPNTEQAITILKTKDGKTTDSSKTSLIFNSKYEVRKPHIGSVDVDGQTATENTTPLFNPGVQLKVFGTDIKAKNETYTSTLTWTLVDSL